MQSEPQTEVPEGVEVRAVETHKPSGQRQGAVEGKRKGEKTRKGQKEKKGSGKHKSHKRGRVHPHQAEFEAAVDAVVATSNDIGVAGVEVIADAVMAFKLIGQPSARAAAGSGAGSDAGAGARSHATAPATGEAQQKVGGGASAVAPPRKKGARGRPRRRVSFPPTLDALIADRFYSHCTSPVVLMLRVAELLCVRHPEEALPFVWLRAIGSVLRLRTRLGPVGSACLSKASDSGAAVPVAAGTDPVDAGATGAIGSTALKPSATTPDRSRSGPSAAPRWSYSQEEREEVSKVLLRFPTRCWATALRALRPPLPVVELLMPHVERMVQTNDMLTAAPIIIATGWHDRFNTTAIMAELTRLESFDIASKFARSCPHAATTSIPVLIGLLMERRQAKLAMKLIKNFRLNPEDFPEVLHARSVAAMRWMLLDSSKRATHSMVVAFLDENPRLVPEALAVLCRKTAKFGPHHEMTRWVLTKYTSPELLEQFPSVVPMAPEEFALVSANLAAEADEVAPGCLALPDGVIVTFVDTASALQTACDRLSRGPYVGIDCEWRAATPGSSSDVAVLQLAIMDEAVLVDMVTLASTVDGSVIDTALARVFHGPDATIVGFDCDGDFRELRRSYPFLKCLQGRRPSRVVDVSRHKLRRFSLPAADATSVKSLSGLVHRVMGKPMDKRQQLSNWDARPLSKGQCMYAALDAWVLLALLEKAAFRTQHPPEAAEG